MPSSSMPKAGIVFGVLGFLAFIIGFGSPYWTVTSLMRSGLWMYCTILDDCEFFKNEMISDKFETVRAFEGIGFICTLVALLFSVLYTCVSKTSGNKFVGILSILACFGAAGTILIGVIIYGSEYDNLDWAFGLATAGGVLFGISGVLHIVFMCQT